jgi:hypothetical protein
MSRNRLFKKAAPAPNPYAVTDPKTGSVITMDYGSSSERNNRSRFVETFRKCPIPDNSVMANLGLFLSSKTLSRVLFMDFLYQQAVEVQGVVMDFGTRWGQNMALFAALRGIYEPFNRHKKLIGFDTFAGFPSVTERDGASEMIRVGNIGVTDDYLSYLREVMACQEGDNPLAHLTKHEFVVGDACQTIHRYLKDHPETIVALAYFDFDLYAPTKACFGSDQAEIGQGQCARF